MNDSQMVIIQFRRLYFTGVGLIRDRHRCWISFSGVRQLRGSDVCLEPVWLAGKGGNIEEGLSPARSSSRTLWAFVEEVRLALGGGAVLSPVCWTVVVDSEAGLKGRLADIESVTSASRSIPEPMMFILLGSLSRQPDGMGCTAESFVVDPFVLCSCATLLVKSVAFKPVR